MTAPDEKIVYLGDLDALAEIEQQQPVPAPDLTLGAVGMKIYEKRCRMLMDDGTFSEVTRSYAENLAMSKENVDRDRIAENRINRGDLELIRSMEMRLEKASNAGPIADVKVKGQNPYPSYGFAKRARQKVQANKD